MSVVRRLVLLAAILLVAAFAVPADADSAALHTTRVSAAPGMGVDGGTDPHVTDDGGFIVFVSSSSILVEGDNNGADDVFAYATATGNVTRVSLASDGSEADGDSGDPAISADGGTIVFVSSATNLDAAAVGVAGDLYMRETATGVTTRITGGWDDSALNGWVGEPQISADGSTIVYASLASNIVPDDTNGTADVFEYDVDTGVTIKVSRSAIGANANGPSSHPAVSADGSLIVYESTATDIVADDTNTASDVFAYDTITGTTDRASLTESGGQADAASDHPGLAPDGSTVVFESQATNLTEIATQAGYDIYVRDLATGAVALVSVATDGTPGDGPSRNPRISADGLTVVYESEASNLVAGDTNSTADVFAHETSSGATTRVSVADDGTETDAASRYPAVASDGTRVVYESDATSLATNDDNAHTDVFLTQIVNRPPVVADASLTVPEDARIGDAIGLVPAADPDNDDLTYTVTDGDEAVFAVDNHGNVTTKQLLDFETRNTYGLTVDVSDGHLVESASLAIEVTNVNERPETSDFETSVPENAPIGTLVDTVTASDPDGDPLSFSITRHPGGAFAVDPVTGDITTTAVLDYETDPGHTVTVAVSDGTLQTESRVVVTVSNVNEAPTVSGFAAQTPEDTPVGVIVGALTASDPEGDALTFEITDGNAGGAFAVDEAGNVLVARGLDYETVPGFTLTVAGSDGELAGETTVTIAVTDVYEVDPAFDPFDDDGFFEADIEWLAYSGITRGCAPRLFCPDDPVTREQLAVFLVRALSLPAPSHDYFTDDKGSSFEDAINRLAEAGITKGCNPGDGNTHFCPQDAVSRGEMAAFLVRALGYTDEGAGNLFSDDDGSIFESVIDKLATAGVTRGCNPPANDNYCPDDLVTRGQMAAFLHRALG